MALDPRYSVEVERRLRELPGAGDLPGDARAAITARADAGDGGARVQFTFRIEGGVVADARFRAYGCPFFIAAASWLTERLVGASRLELAEWDWQEAADALDVPPARFGRLITLQDAIRAAASRWPGGGAAPV
jgi:NifU-like protein involved in Fe-S cluster formation